MTKIIKLLISTSYAAHWPAISIKNAVVLNVSRRTVPMKLCAVCRLHKCSIKHNVQINKYENEDSSKTKAAKELVYESK